MGLCGYNELIGGGIRQTSEGIIEAMLNKHKAGLPICEVIDNELAELIAANRKLKERANTQSILDAFIAINLFAEAILLRVKDRHINSGRWNADAFVEFIRCETSDLVEKIRKADFLHRAFQSEIGSEGTKAIESAITELIRDG